MRRKFWCRRIDIDRVIDILNEETANVAQDLFDEPFTFDPSQMVAFDSDGIAMEPFPPNEPNIYLADVETTYGSLVPQSTVDLPHFAAVLWSRYGFVAPEPYTPHARLAAGVNVEPTANNVRRAMSNLCVKTCMGKDESRYDRPFFDVYHHVMKGSEDVTVFPPLWDFDPGFRTHILEDTYFHYRRVSSGLHLIGVRDKPLHEQWYLLALEDATTVLQIFRERYGTIGAIVTGLVRQGIAFSTVKCARRGPTPARESQSVGLGKRPHGYKFDVVEYMAYESAKNNLLETSVGRTAVTHGGIIWRLAKEMVQMKAIKNGPSRLCTSDGGIIGKWNEYLLVDDRLSLCDEDVICGVYYVATSKLFYNDN